MEELNLRQKISELLDGLEAMNGLLKVMRDYLDEKKDDAEGTSISMGLDVIKCLCVLVDSLRRQADDIDMMTAEIDFVSHTT